MHIEYLEFTTPDYFCGFGGIIFAVSWYPEQTWRMLKEDLLEDINGVDSGQWDVASFAENCEQLVNDIFCDETLDDIIEHNGDVNNESFGFYHYFGLVED